MLSRRNISNTRSFKLNLDDVVYYFDDHNRGTWVEATVQRWDAVGSLALLRAKDGTYEERRLPHDRLVPVQQGPCAAWAAPRDAEDDPMELGVAAAAAPAVAAWARPWCEDDGMALMRAFLGRSPRQAHGLVLHQVASFDVFLGRLPGLVERICRVTTGEPGQQQQHEVRLVNVSHKLPCVGEETALLTPEDAVARRVTYQAALFADIAVDGRVRARGVYIGSIPLMAGCDPAWAGGGASPHDAPGGGTTTDAEEGGGWLEATASRKDDLSLASSASRESNSLASIAPTVCVGRATSAHACAPPV